MNSEIDFSGNYLS